MSFSFLEVTVAVFVDVGDSSGIEEAFLALANDLRLSVTISFFNARLEGVQSRVITRSSEDTT